MKITHLKWRMQSHAQEQPLALAAVKSLYSTNGKEEEVNTGEAALSLISPHSNTVARAVQLLSSWMTEDVLKCIQRILFKGEIKTVRT